MRLIDADALKRKVQKIATESWKMKIMASVEIILNQFIDYIEQSPSVGGWVSVKDRLPKSMANKVLVWLEHEDLVGYIGFGHYEKYKGQEIWFDLEHNEPFSIRGYTVTYWMPMPEPPQD